MYRIAFFVSLFSAILSSDAAYGMTAEFSGEVCSGVSGTLVSTDACAVIDQATGAKTFVVTIAVGIFGETKVLGTGGDMHAALVGTFTFGHDEVANIDEARSKALEAFNASAPARKMKYTQAPMCAAKSSPTQGALDFVETLVAASRVPENQCKP